MTLKLLLLLFKILPKFVQKVYYIFSISK